MPLSGHGVLGAVKVKVVKTWLHAFVPEETPATGTTPQQLRTLPSTAVAILALNFQLQRRRGTHNVGNLTLRGDNGNG